MSIFGFNQVGELVLGNAVATEGTISAFRDSASNKELKALANDGGTAATGKKFRLYQKTNGDAAKNLEFEFSDVVDPKKIERVVLKEYSPEVQKLVTVSGLTDNVLANTTYAVNIRLYNEGGSMSVENFRILSGYHTTGATVAGVTAANIAQGIVDALNIELVSRGNSEFTVTRVGDDITIESKYQEVVPGKITGRPIEFDVTTKVMDLGADDNLGLLTVTTTTQAYPGNGTAKQVINKEWFIKGFKYEPYREMAYPSNFNTPYYANGEGIYNTIQISYKSDRISPTVEEQHKELIIYVEKATNDAAGNAATNDMLADLRTFIGTNADVPADLAVL